MEISLQELKNMPDNDFKFKLFGQLFMIPFEMFRDICHKHPKHAHKSDNELIKWFCSLGIAEAICVLNQLRKEVNVE